ncbi:winged helix-turn-helix transcriptional regulator [Ideonella sp. BN130291]|uniref:winged helix-turn-helix transcriptional regulator n=1 Tax=Ideonella sp. BN130291 TaxID=3112940 RepID=UPI002E257F6A|nr:helix-turn-helix domain-containing protein [Ideonella sp. BN130291]
MTTPNLSHTPDALDVEPAMCPSQRVLQAVASKWALPIVAALAQGPMRNGQLCRHLHGVSQKVLSQTLRELEQQGLVHRQDHDCVPPKVEYVLSDAGHGLNAALRPVDVWAEANGWSRDG